MSGELARKVADAVLLEGYLLYPYRASAPKNQLRWQFGVIVPAGAETGDPAYHQTECLLDRMSAAVRLDLTVRFLQVRRRTGTVPWDEGVVREVTATIVPGAGTAEFPFRFLGGRYREDGVERRSWPLAGRIVVDSETVDRRYGTIRLRWRVTNDVDWTDRTAPRADVLRQSLIAVHSIAEVAGGQFLSLRDPPRWAGALAAGCDNRHTWPVLIDDNVLLSSPIVLDDRPEIAPESPMDLHDATEIDELLMLRTMTLTDAEKAEARATDPRGAAIVDAADTLPREVLEKLHGAVRGLRRVPEAPPAERPERPPWWDPGADASVSPETDRVEVPGGWASRGSRVRLRPGRRRTDAQDMFLHGRTATVRAVLFDVEDTGYLAVTVDGDPAAELNDDLGRFRYFGPDEVELVE